MSGYDSTEDMIVCPYDPVHKVKRNHMFKHLTKCSKNHPHIILETCPFNSLHRFKKEDEETHLMDCPNRASFESYLQGTDDEKIPIKAIVDKSGSTENWDNDYDYPSYDPKKKLENSLISRQLRCATKSEKRKFRENERERCSKLRKIFQESGDDNVYTREKMEFKREPDPEPEQKSEQEVQTSQELQTSTADISSSTKQEVLESEENTEVNNENNEGSNNESVVHLEIASPTTCSITAPKIEVLSTE